jgi:toxin HigB-1
VKFGSFKSKAIKRLYQEDSSKDLPAETLTKLRTMLTFLQDMQAAEELRRLPLWKAHQLTGDRKGVWSLSVTRNWRLTFKIIEQTIVEVDFEDYH